MEEDINPVLAEFARAVEESGTEQTDDWIGRCPQFRREILDYALLADRLRGADEARRKLAETDPRTWRAEQRQMEAEADRLRAETRERLRQMQAGAPSEPMQGLVQAARKKGIDASGLASALRVGLDVLMHLDRRLLDPTSIPRALLARTAEALGRSVDEVARYLVSAPTLGAAAMYRSEQAPALQLNMLVREDRGGDNRPSFSQALQQSTATEPADREYWASQPVDDGDGAE